MAAARVALLVLLATTAPAAATTTFTTKAELVTAVHAWLDYYYSDAGGDDPAATYGHISTWDVSGVDDMSGARVREVEFRRASSKCLGAENAPPPPRLSSRLIRAQVGALLRVLLLLSVGHAPRRRG